MSLEQILGSFLILLSVGCSTHKPTEEQNSSLISIDKPIIKNLDEVDPQFKKMQKSLVRIHLQDEQKNTSIGTGFFFKTKELLVTNFHVLEGQPDCIKNNECILHLGLAQNAKDVIEYAVKVSVIFKYRDKDLAFLKVHDTEKLAEIIPLQNKAKNSQGKLMAVGFYHDDPAITFSEGKSLKNQTETHKALSSIIVSAGFSGSPVINKDGELVGVVTSYKPIRGQHIGLAEYIRADDVSSF